MMHVVKSRLEVLKRKNHSDTSRTLTRSWLPPSRCRIADVSKRRSRLGDLLSRIHLERQESI